MITYSDVSNPQWANEEMTDVLVNVKWSTVPVIVRTILIASNADQHVQSLLAEIINGDHGPIAAYVPPSQEQLSAIAVAQSKREVRRLISLYVTPYAQDILSWGDLTLTSQESITVYRKALLNIDKQPGYPENITWPTPPNIEFLPSDD